MNCPECQFDNREGARFCSECGCEFEAECPECAAKIRAESKFCDKCGCDIIAAKEISDKTTETEDLSIPPSDGIYVGDSVPTEGERKHVTVLFSDLTGYTAMSERLDPEEVKEITSRIFSEISKIVDKYDGFIEKYAGDAVMALFGVPKTHEDDPIRAVKAAREIHELADSISPEVEGRIGQSISMHTGINTGLVVTGEVNVARGTHGVAGDTINLAARLSNLAKPGEILIDVDTCRQAEGHFECEYLEETTVKGKADPVLVHKVLSHRDKPITIHRLSGLRADLIGRKVELDRLSEAIERLRNGKGTIITICGDAGTGKSRLIEEFKATLDLKEIQWREGHAYPYTQNRPYFPHIDIMNRAFRIEEGDPPERIREKVHKGIEVLLGKQEDIVPFVGSLYALSYPEIEGVSPEFWKSQLQKAIREILLALTRRRPTVICFEDLHWADPSSIDLVHFLLSDFRYPAVFLCAYRPAFSLFTSHQVSSLGELYHEIRLLDLSASEAQDMVVSLLKSKSVPPELQRFIQQKVEGNPFYLEEMINSLIESETLIRDNGTWKLTKPITELDIPSTIHGVLSARFDRLEREMKRVLQEASVIGRAFLYEILKRITDLSDQCDQCLGVLERLNLIRTRSLQPDLEYIFKHALTQEVVYNGLLKKERRILHEKIGLVVEKLFHDRLSEFYETLAFHFKNGHSLHKAVEYLMKSGEKCINRYAVEESHQYYKEALDILISKPSKSKEEEELIIDLLIKWAYVFYYLGDFNGLIDLFSNHEDLAESIDDKAKVGMFNAWLGFALFMGGKAQFAHQYVLRALELGEEIGDQKVIAYACTWIAWNSWDMGLLDQVITFGERANEISKSIELDHYLYFKPLAAIGQNCLTTGDGRRALVVGKAMLEYGQKHSNVRSITMGYISIAFSQVIIGDLQSAIESFQRAIQISADPVYSEYARCFLGATYLFAGKIQEAEEVLKASAAHCKKFGYGAVGHYADGFLGVVYVFKGQLSDGLEMLEKAISESEENGRITAYVFLENTLGNVYLQLIDREIPLVSEKAEDHLNKAVEVAKEIGAKGVLSQAYLNLGLLYKVKGRPDQARIWISESIQIFEQCKADFFLKHAKAALESI